MIQKLAEPSVRLARDPHEKVFVKSLWEGGSAGEYGIWIGETLSLRLWVVADGMTLHVRAFTPYDNVGWLLLEDSVRDVLRKYPHVRYDFENPIRCDVAGWREL